MVKINQGLSDFAEIEEGQIYKITGVSENTQKGFKGISIEFKPKVETEENKKIKYQVTAWLGQGETVGTRSKLGSFIVAFTEYFEKTGDETKEALAKAQDTDKWKEHMIKVIEWRNKNREIKVIS